MSRLLRASVLFAAIAGLTVATSLNNPAPAQVKDKDKKDKEKKDDKASALEVGTIEVFFVAKDGWRFRVRVDDKSIAIGTIGYEKKEDALKAIESVKAAMAKGKVVEVKSDKKNKKDKK
jgi:uncharacterized protein YegP (UPF0339 family)